MYERNSLLMNRKFREYLIPTVLVNIALSLEMVINSAVVGNLLGEATLSAIGLSAPVIYIINTLFMLIVIGGVTGGAIAKGRRNDKEANGYFTLVFTVGMAAMITLLIVLLVFMEPITRTLAQGDAELARLTRQYLTPLVFVGPMVMLIMGMAQFTRTDGWPRLSACIALTVNGVSLGTCYVFIRFFGMGIAGASLSTLLGYVVGFFVLLPYLFSKRRTFRFIRLPERSKTKLLEMMSIGLPDALTQLLSFLRVLVLNALVVSVLGAQGMAAMTVCLTALVLTTIFVSGTTNTFLPIVGTLYGEKDTRGIRFTVHTGFKFMVAACVAFMLLFLAIPAEIAQLFGINSAEGIAVAVPALRYYTLSLPLFGINTLFQSFFQTTGRQKLASVIVVLNGFVCVVLFAAVLVNIHAETIWLAFLFSELTTFLVLLALGRHIRKKEAAHGLLLLREEEGVSADFTIPADIEAAAGLSEQIVDFCRKNGTGKTGAMRMGIAVEEMAVNTARYGGEPKNAPTIDALLRFSDQELILRLRDDGKPFDPTQYEPEEKNKFALGGIELVRRLAKDVNYTRQLGFNVTIIKIERTVLTEELVV